MPKTVREFLREYVERGIRIPKLPPKPTLPPLSELRKSEWNAHFETLMRNRLIMGAFRYGLFHSEEKGAYDCVGSMYRRILRYHETGNLEYLVDVANLAMIEFTEGRHPNRHFAAIDDGEHTAKKGQHA